MEKSMFFFKTFPNQNYSPFQYFEGNIKNGQKLRLFYAREPENFIVVAVQNNNVGNSVGGGSIHLHTNYFTVLFIAHFFKVKV